MSVESVVPVMPEIEKWLEKNYEKILSFWLYADWNKWARYDLYTDFMKDMARYPTETRPRGDYSASHGVRIWGENEPEVDMTITSLNDDQTKGVAIWICTATPGENDTSFSKFVNKFQKEWQQVQDLTNKYGRGDFEGEKLLFLGIGEKAYDEDGFDFGGLKPEYKGYGGKTPYEGTVYMYYLWLDLPKAKE